MEELNTCSAKLLKYDLRANLRTLLPLWLTTIGLSLVCTLLYGARVTPQTALGRFLLLILPAIALVLLMGAMFTVSVVYMVRGFSRGLLGQDGYLMFTLPVSTSSLIASKALSALIVEVLTVVASGACVAVLITMNATWAELRGAFEEMFRAMREVTDAHPDFLPTLCVVIVSGLLVDAQPEPAYVPGLLGGPAGGPTPDRAERRRLLRDFDSAGQNRPLGARAFSARSAQRRDRRVRRLPVRRVRRLPVGRCARAVFPLRDLLRADALDPRAPAESGIAGTKK